MHELLLAFEVLSPMALLSYGSERQKGEGHLIALVSAATDEEKAWSRVDIVFG